jgi:membrane protease YdiL (CAAX protease family)
MIAIIVVLGVFVFGSVIGLVAKILGYSFVGNSNNTLRAILIAQCLAYVAALWFMRHLIVAHYHARWNDAVRWRWPAANWFTWIAAGIMLAVGVQFMSMLLPVPRALPIDRYFQNSQAAWMMSIFGITMAPLFEELFFRGFLYPVLARRVGIMTGAALTALGFAFLHASQLGGAWAPLLMLFIVGLTLTIVRIVKNAVAPTFLMHVGYNLTLFTLLWMATDHFRHMEKLLQQ